MSQLPTFTEATDQLLLDRIAYFNGDKTAAARSLRICVKTVYNWLNRIEARKSFIHETTAKTCDCDSAASS